MTTQKTTGAGPELTMRDGAGALAVLWAVVIRVVILAAYYVMVAVTVFGVIPVLAMWIHDQGGASTTELSPDGLIAIWLVPFVFAVAMTAVGELAVMRWMWRLGTAAIARLRSRGAPSTPSSAPRVRTSSMKKAGR